MKKLIILFISLLIAGNVYGADTKLADLTEDATPALTSLMYNVTAASADRKSTLGQMFSAATDLDANGVISANSVALTTDTTGNYAGGDAEAGSALTGDAAVDFVGAGVTAVTDATACTDIEGTKLSIGGGTLNVTETDSVVGAITGLIKANGAGTISQAVAGTDYLVDNQTITLLGDVTGSGTTSILSTIVDSIAVTSWNLTTPTLTGITTVADAGTTLLDTIPASDETQTGITSSQTMGTTVAHGDVVYLAVADSRWEFGDASASASSFGLAMALGAGGDGDAVTVLHYGIVRQDTDWNWTVGTPIYLSITGTTTNTLTQTAPTTDGDQVVVVGYALTADSMMFNPSMVLVEVAV